MFQTRGGCESSRNVSAFRAFLKDILDPRLLLPGVHPAVVVRVMNDEQSQEVEALAAIMGEDMWTDAEQPRSYCFFVSPQCDSDTEVCCC